MCLSLKKLFLRPLKMLYRYKSKWYMPPKLKQRFGLVKAKSLQKDKAKFIKKYKLKTLNNLNEESITLPRTARFVDKSALPQLVKKKIARVFQKKTSKYQLSKKKANIIRKKKIMKNYLNTLLSEKHNEKTNKIYLITKSLNNLNSLVYKYQQIKYLDIIKQQTLNRSNREQRLKKRIINTFANTFRYFVHYPTMQLNVLTTTHLINKIKKLKKIHLILNYLKVRQSLSSYKLKEKEIFDYNEDILDSNFLESNLRENLGIAPTKNLSNYFMNKIKELDFIPFNFIHKKRLRFRLKKKNRFKKSRDKAYYKKRRIIFEERSYNRLGVNDIKRDKLKWKRNSFTQLNIKIRKDGIKKDYFVLINKIKQNKLIMYKKKKRKLLFIDPEALLRQMQLNLLVKSKIELKSIIKNKFASFINLIKIEINKNKKIIRKYTKKILFFKKQKAFFYRKKKIDALNERDLFIRENQKLRDEISQFKYIWKTSSLYNYDNIKQEKLNIILELRKKKKGLLDILKKYPEGFSPLRERLKSSQYYTGLSLLKRKLEQGDSYLDLSVFIRAYTLSENSSIISGLPQVKWDFAGPKRSYTLCNTKL